MANPTFRLVLQNAENQVAEGNREGLPLCDTHILIKRHQSMVLTRFSTELQSYVEILGCFFHGEFCGTNALNLV